MAWQAQGGEREERVLNSTQSIHKKAPSLPPDYYNQNPQARKKKTPSVGRSTHPSIPLARPPRVRTHLLYPEEGREVLVEVGLFPARRRGGRHPDLLMVAVVGVVGVAKVVSNRGRYRACVCK